MRGGPSYYPNEVCYEDTPYSPRQPSDLTDSQGAMIIGEFIDAACERGLEVHLQMGAVQPSELREEDVPRLPD